MPSFNQLPVNVQSALLKSNGLSPGDYAPKNITLKNAVGHNGLWVAPTLNYDFNESNFLTLVINLTKVGSLNAGPASAAAFTKTNPALPAYIIFDSCDEATGAPVAQVYECV